MSTRRTYILTNKELHIRELWIKNKSLNSHWHELIVANNGLRALRAEHLAYIENALVWEYERDKIEKEQKQDQKCREKCKCAWDRK